MRRTTFIVSIGALLVSPLIPKPKSKHIKLTAKKTFTHHTTFCGGDEYFIDMDTAEIKGD